MLEVAIFIRSLFLIDTPEVEIPLFRTRGDIKF